MSLLCCVTVAMVINTASAMITTETTMNGARSVSADSLMRLLAAASESSGQNRTSEQSAVTGSSVDGVLASVINMRQLLDSRQFVSGEMRNAILMSLIEQVARRNERAGASVSSPTALETNRSSDSPGGAFGEKSEPTNQQSSQSESDTVQTNRDQSSGSGAESSTKLDGGTPEVGVLEGVFTTNHMAGVINSNNSVTPLAQTSNDLVNDTSLSINEANSSDVNITSLYEKKSSLNVATLLTGFLTSGSSPVFSEQDESSDSVVSETLSDISENEQQSLALSDEFDNRTLDHLISAFDDTPDQQLNNVSVSAGVSNDLDLVSTQQTIVPVRNSSTNNTELSTSDVLMSVVEINKLMADLSKQLSVISASVNFLKNSTNEKEDTTTSNGSASSRLSQNASQSLRFAEELPTEFDRENRNDTVVREDGLFTDSVRFSNITNIAALSENWNSTLSNSSLDNTRANVKHSLAQLVTNPISAGDNRPHNLFTSISLKKPSGFVNGLNEAGTGSLSMAAIDLKKLNVIESNRSEDHVDAPANDLALSTSDRSFGQRNRSNWILLANSSSVDKGSVAMGTTASEEADGLNIKMNIPLSLAALNEWWADSLHLGRNKSTGETADLSRQTANSQSSGSNAEVPFAKELNLKDITTEAMSESVRLMKSLNDRSVFIQLVYVSPTKNSTSTVLQAQNVHHSSTRRSDAEGIPASMPIQEPQDIAATPATRYASASTRNMLKTSQRRSPDSTDILNNTFSSNKQTDDQLPAAVQFRARDKNTTSTQSRQLSRINTGSALAVQKNRQSKNTTQMRRPNDSGRFGMKRRLKPLKAMPVQNQPVNVKQPPSRRLLPNSTKSENFSDHLNRHNDLHSLDQPNQSDVKEHHQPPPTTTDVRVFFEPARHPNQISFDVVREPTWFSSDPTLKHMEPYRRYRVQYTAPTDTIDQANEIVQYPFRDIADEQRSKMHSVGSFIDNEPGMSFMREARPLDDKSQESNSLISTFDDNFSAELTSDHFVSRSRRSPFSREHFEPVSTGSTNQIVDIPIETVPTHQAQRKVVKQTMNFNKYLQTPNLRGRNIRLLKYDPSTDSSPSNGRHSHMQSKCHLMAKHYESKNTDEYSPLPDEYSPLLFSHYGPYTMKEKHHTPKIPELPDDTYSRYDLPLEKTEFQNEVFRNYRKYVTGVDRPIVSEVSPKIHSEPMIMPSGIEETVFYRSQHAAARSQSLSQTKSYPLVELNSIADGDEDSQLSRSDNNGLWYGDMITRPSYHEIAGSQLRPVKTHHNRHPSLKLSHNVSSDQLVKDQSTYNITVIRPALVFDSVQVDASSLSSTGLAAATAATNTSRSIGRLLRNFRLTKANSDRAADRSLTRGVVLIKTREG